MSPMCRALVAGVALSVAAPLAAVAGVLITVHNPSQLSRKCETVEVRLSDLLDRDGALGKESIVVIDQGSKKELVVQVTEAALLFQSDFAPGETRTFLAAAGKKKAEGPVSSVDGFFALPREDYAWENDRVAFRVYGPALAAEVNNGIDVWTKRVRERIVRKWYEADAASGTGNYYHTDRGEGADFFAVGRTLGAGGSGLWYKDSLHQPGVFTSHRVVSNGPIRTSFELSYAWNVAGKRFTETKRIALDAGRNLNIIEIRFVGLAPEDSPLIACGVVKRKNVTVQVSDDGSRAALWGPTNDDSANGFLGTGIVLDPASVARRIEDSVHVLLLGRMVEGRPFRYLAGAGWTRSGDFSDAAAWQTYLKEESLKLDEPLQITFAPDRP